MLHVNSFLFVIIVVLMECLSSMWVYTWNHFLKVFLNHRRSKYGVVSICLNLQLNFYKKLWNVTSKEHRWKWNLLNEKGTLSSMATMLNKNYCQQKITFVRKDESNFGEIFYIFKSQRFLFELISHFVLFNWNIKNGN